MKSIKTLFLKKEKMIGDDAKKTKRLTEIQFLMKDFTSYKNRSKPFVFYKKKKVMQVIK